MENKKKKLEYALFYEVCFNAKSISLSTLHIRKANTSSFTCCFYWNLNENSPPPLSLSSKANYCCHRPWFCLMLHLPKGNGNHMPRHNPFGAALLCRPQSMHPLSFDGSGCSQSRSRFPLLLTHLPGPCCLYFKLAARLAHPPARNAKKDRCM